jgi:hypothetical protein
MKTILLVLVILSAIPVFSQQDSARKKLKAAGTVSFNHNGIAPVPSFSLDKPALIANFILAKGRFSYEPGLAYSLELKPWYIDNWLNYRIVDRQKFTLTAGFNASSFFGPDTSKSDQSILRAERYFALALTAIFRLSSSFTLSAAYWSDNGMDGGLRGHFISVVGERTNIRTGDKTFLNASLQMFYLNYTGNNDGLFITPRLSFNIMKFPLSVFVMGTQPLQSNIEPFPEFKWNLGLAFAF